MILNNAQAEAIYSAMCALNNVGSTYLRVNFLRNASQRIAVTETKEGVGITLLAHPASSPLYCRMVRNALEEFALAEA